MNKQPLRVAVIGMGGFAGAHHEVIKDLEESGACRLVCACDPQPEQFTAERGRGGAGDRSTARRCGADDAMSSPHPEHSARLGMIADDLTGACDTGAQFAARGFCTVVLLGPENRADEEADLLVITTNSRDEPPHTAREKVARACSRLTREGATVFYKKIDSTLRGHIGIETEAILAACGHPFAVIAPAFPAMGRTLAGGNLRVHSVGRLADAHLPSLLGRQVGDGVGTVDYGLVRLGQVALHAEMARFYANGHRYVVADAITEQDLQVIARAALTFTPRPLLVGSGGLAAPLAEILAHAKTQRREVSPLVSADDTDYNPQSVVLFIGSRHPITAAQVERLMAGGQAEIVPLDERTVEAACEAASAGKHLVVPIRWKGRREERVLRELLSLLEEIPWGGLVLSGGDTAALLCSLLGAQAIRLEGEIRTGIPWGRLIGERAQGRAVCTKAGGFGAEDALVAAVDFLTTQNKG